MGLHDRPYWREEGSGGGFGPAPGGGLFVGVPKPTPAVKVLLIMNLVMFVAQVFADQGTAMRLGPMTRYLGVTAAAWWQVWRYVTFQFLHGDFWHIAMNMLGVYMLGSPLEQRIGTRMFTWFYLSCGAFAGVLYAVVMGLWGLAPHMPIIGASGGVFAIVLAAAVYMPNFRLILVLFPVPIRLAALLIFGGMLLFVLQGLSMGGGAALATMSDVAHLGGAIAAAGWVWGFPRVSRATSEMRTKINDGAWERKMRRQQEEQDEVDRILKKIRDEGINSLSGRERRALKNATQRQREEEKRIRRG
jgi:membrane associated rhomboid family serine protease